MDSLVAIASKPIGGDQRLNATRKFCPGGAVGVGAVAEVRLGRIAGRVEEVAQPVAEILAFGQMMRRRQQVFGRKGFARHGGVPVGGSVGACRAGKGGAVKIMVVVGRHERKVWHEVFLWQKEAKMKKNEQNQNY